MKKGLKVGITLVVLGVVLGTVFGIIGYKKYRINQYFSHYTPPPVTISAAGAVAGQWNIYLNSVGTLYAVDGVDLSAEVSGIIRRIDFAPGQEVRKGQALLNMDDSTERADLKSLQAQLELARINYQRDLKLLATKSISKTDFDTGEARLKDIQAQVEALQATIAKKTIRAPFSGKAGIPHVDAGQYISPGQVIVTLQSLNRLYVDFQLPERRLPQLSTGQTVLFSVTAYGDRSFKARISAIDAKVDPNTRNIQVRATLDNDDRMLTPGMFAEVHVVLPQPKKVVILPQTAISYSLYGNSVFILEPENSEADNGRQGKTKAGAGKSQKVYRVHRHYVSVLDRRGAKVAISKGVKPGELVVTAGQLKLNNGTRVVIDNSVTM